VAEAPLRPAREEPAVRETAFRAAEAALPANDRVLLRAMGSLPGRGAWEWNGVDKAPRAVRAPEGIAPGVSTQSRHAR
jgi:hypothetical protein